MKNQGKGGAAGLLLRLPSPTGSRSSSSSSSRVQLCHDYQRVAFKAHPGNGHATQDGPHRPGVGPDSRSSWVVDSSSQGESTDPQETLTESSTLTFVDAHAAEESSSLGGVATVRLREFVLIDDDDDGDMSLREKTVTDVSVTGGAAADLVCRRLFSSSSGSVSDGKAESPAPGAPPPAESPTAPDKTGCCLCSIL